MSRYEYMRIHITLIPQEVIDEYHLKDIVDDTGHIWVEIRKGMYGLPQAGILANKLLEKRLAKAGYVPTPHTPGLWKHVWRPVTFTLVVDDFGVKYVGRQHVDHLLNTLQEHYKISTDWEGSLYCGITLKWDYATRTVDASMPGYVQKILEKLQHPTPMHPEHAPHKAKPVSYGTRVQMTYDVDTMPGLDQDGVTRIQQIVGALLFYA